MAGASMKDIKLRIRSVESTMQITKAMELVASSKLRKAKERQERSRPYFEGLKDTLADIEAATSDFSSPYQKKREVKKQCLIVIAGDRGLAGGYNANIFRAVAQMADIEILPIGKRACDRYGQGYISAEDFSRMDAAELARKLCAEFASGEFDRLGILYTRYISMMSQEPVVEWVLPLEKPEGVREASVLFEPNEQEVLDSVVPSYVAGRIVHAVREGFACEVAARRMAMDSAGKNAQAMIDDLQLQYNRARQNAITQEITEIVAGSGNY